MRLGVAVDRVLRGFAIAAFHAADTVAAGMGVPWPLLSKADLPEGRLGVTGNRRVPVGRCG